MKHYNLDKIDRFLDKVDPLLIRCREYIIVMSNFYKRQGVDIPKEVKELKYDLTEILNEIGKENNGK